jgi:arylsulfatase
MRTSASLSIAWAAAAFLGPALQSLSAEAPPNVVIVFADDLGYGDLACYGAENIATPNLDRLAREGVRLSNFHVAQPVCSASRTALLTGCYPNRLGIHGALGPQARHGIADGETTLAEMLRTRGYATGMAGKWHLGHRPTFLPTRHGFDEYLGLPYSNDMWPHHPEAAAGTYPALPMIENETVIDADVSPEDQTRLTETYTKRAVRFIEAHAGQPFFFYLAHSMPHVPLFAGEKFRGRSSRGLYGDVIEEIDASVGRILGALDRTGAAENTIVIFTSDNGPWLSYGDHAGSAGRLREGKGTCWEGGVRVPCIVRWPKGLAGGVVNDSFLMTIDLLPTLAGRTGASLPPLPIDGKDVWPLVSGEPGASNPHEAYYFYYQAGALFGVATGDGKWKLMLPHVYRSLEGRPGGTGGVPAKYGERRIERPELFDLAADPYETTDVSSRHPEVVERMLALAETARADLGDALLKREGAGVRKAGQWRE